MLTPWTASPLPTSATPMPLQSGKFPPDGWTTRSELCTSAGILSKDSPGAEGLRLRVSGLGYGSASEALAAAVAYEHGTDIG